MTEQNKGEIGNEQSPEELAKLKAEEESNLKLQESEKEKLGKPGEEKPKVDDKTDYKALFETEKKEREAAEVAQKQMLSGLTPKLQQLADYERADAERTAKAAESDELIEIDAKIEEIDKQIPLYKQDSLDTTALTANRLALKNQRKQILRDRATSATTKEWLDFGDGHPDFDDYAGLNKIVAEAAKRKDPISPNTAFRIWEKDQKIAKAEESAAIDKDSKDLSKKAVGEDGKPIPDAKDAKSGATWEFYKEQYGEEKAAEMLGIK